MRTLALDLGVPAERIELEERSRNTFENALYTAVILRRRGWRRVAVVTDAFHMPRALYVFRRLGLDAVGEPVRHRCGGSRLAWYAGWIREPGALLRSAYLFRIGRDKPLVEAVWGE